MEPTTRTSEAPEIKRLRRALYLIDAVCMGIIEAPGLSEHVRTSIGDIYDMAHRSHGLCAGPVCRDPTPRMDEIEQSMVEANFCEAYETLAAVVGGQTR